MVNSRLPGFYKLSVSERRALIARELGLDETLFWAFDQGGIHASDAEKIVENALGLYALPLGLGLNFRINGRDRLAPMVVEEPSVIAAASNAAKMVRAGGGFRVEATEPLMAAQVELRHVPDDEAAEAAIGAARAELLELANLAVPRLRARGGGARELSVRRLAPGHLVVHVLVDCRDAMGANLVNTVAEALGPRLAALAKGDLGLCILSNLSDHRLVRVRVRVPQQELVGSLTGHAAHEIARGIEAASLFAERDPYRAATHNKGVMNGVDSVVLATGNDARAIEAGAHAYAARSGRYGPLSTWRVAGDFLEGQLELPLALGVVGGTLRVHRGAQLALALAEVESAQELAELAAAVGLASNLAALRALSTEGIQRGHMSLHARSVALGAGALGPEVELVATRLSALGSVSLDQAAAVLLELRQTAAEHENP